jgi:hypothetical protein
MVDKVLEKGLDAKGWYERINFYLNSRPEAPKIYL